MESETVVEPLALVIQGKEQIAAFACGKCHEVASSPRQFIGTEDVVVEVARESARRHCGPWVCTCGEKMERFHTVCRACSMAATVKRDEERTAASIAKAKRVPLADYDGDMVYVEGGESYMSPDELSDRIDDDEAPGGLVWGCYCTGFTLDADRIIEGELETGEHHEDAGDWLAKGANEALKRTLDRWTKKYAKAVKTYFPDYSILIEIAPCTTSAPPAGKP